MSGRAAGPVGRAASCRNTLFSAPARARVSGVRIANPRDPDDELTILCRTRADDSRPPCALRLAVATPAGRVERTALARVRGAAAARRAAPPGRRGGGGGGGGRGGGG